MHDSGWSEHAPNMRPFLGWAWSQISKNLGIFRWTLCPAAKLRRSIFIQRYGWYDQGEYTTISHSTLPILLAYKIQDMTWHLSFLNPFEWLECLNFRLQIWLSHRFQQLAIYGKGFKSHPALLWTFQLAVSAFKNHFRWLLGSHAMSFSHPIEASFFSHLCPQVEWDTLRLWTGEASKKDCGQGQNVPKEYSRVNRTEPSQ